jgi:divalent metal cation (Fe/Co/Zn/Cd) transporter
MDRSVEPPMLTQIREIISKSAEGAVEVHDLKTRIAGRVAFIEFHLVVPGKMPVKAAHDICDRVEAALNREVEGARVLIHIEPEDEAKQTGVPVL